MVDGGGHDRLLERDGNTEGLAQLEEQMLYSA